MKISKFNPKIHRLEEIKNLVKNTFDIFIGDLYTEEGKNEFYKYFDEEVYNQKVINGDLGIYIAKIDDKIIGMIELNYLKSRISLFFVDKDFQKQGIGKKLFNKAILDFKSKKINKITVYSSPNSLKMYEQIGFTKISEEQIINGMKFYDMEMFI